MTPNLLRQIHASSNFPAIPSKRQRLARSSAILACAAMALSSRAVSADNISWQVGVGDWFNANNWIDSSQPDGHGGYLSQVPDSSDYAFVTNGGAAQINGSASASNLQVNSGGLYLSGGSLVCKGLSLGSNGGSGFIVQTGGTDTMDSLEMGYANSSGIYTLQNGTLSTGVEYLCANAHGSGSFVQSGGTNIVSTLLNIAYFAEESGSYTLQNGSLSVPTEVVGGSGDGTFTQSGGTNTVGDLSISSNASSTGIYNLQGGMLNAGFLPIGGTGATFNQSGGTLAATTVTQTGGAATFSGTAATLTVGTGNVLTYNLQGGTMTAGAVVINTGGMFNQTGGTLNAASFTQTGGTSSFSGNAATLTIGTGNITNYNLQGGALTAGAIIINNGGTFTNSAAMTLTGTTVTATSNGGSFTQNAGGTLKVQINGTGNGQFGQLVVGSASLAGSLNVTFGGSFNGTTVSRANRIQIISATTNTGTFAQPALPSIPGRPELFLTTDYTSQGVSVVVNQTQNVVLAFGYSMPEVFKLTTYANGNQGYIAYGPTNSNQYTGPTGAATIAALTQQAILAQVQVFYQSAGVAHVNITIGAPDPNAKDVYFVNPLPSFTIGSQSFSLLGQAYTGVDHYNATLGGAAAIFYDPSNLYEDEVTVAHEVGHTVGLIHVNGADNNEIMNYQTGTSKAFENTISATFDQPPSPTAGFTSNPVYNLRHFVDGVSQRELAAQNILPGTWDIGVAGQSASSNRVAFNSSQDLMLYNVSILSDPNDDAQQTLESFDQISVAQLGALGFSFDADSTVQLYAASSPDGNLDTFLSTGDPRNDWGAGIALGVGEQIGSLERYDPQTSGYVALSSISFVTSQAPEPASLSLFAFGAIALMRRRHAN